MSPADLTDPPSPDARPIPSVEARHSLPATGSAAEELGRQASGKQVGVFAELIGLLRENKKWWLLPIVLFLLVVGALIILSSSAVAPFIYTIF